MIEILNRINQNQISRRQRSNSWREEAGQQEVNKVTRTQCSLKNKKRSSRSRVKRRTTPCWVTTSTRTTLILPQSKTTSRRSSTTLTSRGSRRQLAISEAPSRSWIATRLLSLRNSNRNAASRLIKWLFSISSSNLLPPVLFSSHTIKSSSRNRIRKGGNYSMIRTPMVVKTMK